LEDDTLQKQLVRKTHTNAQDGIGKAGIVLKQKEIELKTKELDVQLEQARGQQQLATISARAEGQIQVHKTKLQSTKNATKEKKDDRTSRVKEAKQTGKPSKGTRFDLVSKKNQINSSRGRSNMRQDDSSDESSHGRSRHHHHSRSRSRSRSNSKSRARLKSRDNSSSDCSSSVSSSSSLSSASSTPLSYSRERKKKSNSNERNKRYSNNNKQNTKQNNKRNKKVKSLKKKEFKHNNQKHRYKDSDHSTPSTPQKPASKRQKLKKQSSSSSASHSDATVEAEMLEDATKKMSQASIDDCDTFSTSEDDRL
jgi:hypothetical protein